VSNNLKKSLFFVKASIPFVLTFSFVVLPIAKSEGEEILKSRNNNQNSQTIKILRNDLGQPSIIGTGGGEILIEDNALLASTIGVEGESRVITSSSDEISVYVVREGDTLSQIAEMFDVKVSTIRGFNNIRKDSDLKPGQELLILPIDGVLYKVEKGDTLSSVAKKWKSDEMDIALFNDISPDGTLTVGSEIIIPNAEALPVVEEPKKETVKTPTKTASSGTKTSAPKSSGSVGNSYPAGFYTHPVPRGSVKSQGFHGPYQAQDLAAPEGTDIVASSAGTVIAVRFGWSGGYGNMVIIDDGRANVLYAHMSKIDVVQGQKVSQGQKIGEVGNTGRSTGPHLHIEYRGKKGPMKTPVW
jgi:murein DD-endopeptidase MepM/ murein hydrolase activator NlpD